MILNNLRRASEGKLILCFPGVGSAFAKTNAQTSVIVGKNGKLVLVDIGSTIPGELHAKGISVTDFDGYYFTHSHSDHVGGVEELLLKSRYVTKKKPSVLITENYQRELWEFTLKGGAEYNETGLMRLGDFVNTVRPRWVQSQPREMYKAEFCGINFLIFRTMHIPGNVAEWESAYWSTGFLLEHGVLFSGDTRFDETLFDHLAGHMHLRLSTIFHDCQLFDPGTVHATFKELQRLPIHIREQMYLMHYGDTFETHDPQPEAAGFRGWAKPWEVYEFPLLS
jgi:L-ascorbate metabolism protein UlaG (beta-lactamase superfamily)